MKPRTKIKDWEFATWSRSAGYGMPIIDEVILVGRLVEDTHPEVKHIEGNRIKTSPIIQSKGDGFVETENTIYELVGEPSRGLANQMAQDRCLPWLSSYGTEYVRILHKTSE